MICGMCNVVQRPEPERPANKRQSMPMADVNGMAGAALDPTPQKAKNAQP